MATLTEIIHFVSSNFQMIFKKMKTKGKKKKLRKEWLFNTFAVHHLVSEILHLPQNK